jgi:hypothetical protein
MKEIIGNVCIPCGVTFLTESQKKEGGVVTTYKGICYACKKETNVTSTRHYNYLVKQCIKVNFTHCTLNHNFKYDIPNYDFDDFDKFLQYIYYVLENDRQCSKVYVCFQSHLEPNYSIGEQDHYSFLITCDKARISRVELFYLDELMKFRSTEDKFIYSIFEFATYNEAFEYAKGLMDGITKLN